MLVRASALINTTYVRDVRAMHPNITIESLDVDFPYTIAESVMELVNNTDVPIAFDICDDAKDGGCFAFTTTFIGLNEPAIVVFAAPDVTATYLEMIVRHELGHAQQIKDGRLQMVDDGILWMGEYVVPLSLPLTIPTNHREVVQYTLAMLRYYAQPWELDVVRSNLAGHFEWLEWPQLILNDYGTLWCPEWDAELITERALELNEIRKAIYELYPIKEGQ